MPTIEELAVQADALAKSIRTYTPPVVAPPAPAGKYEVSFYNSPTLDGSPIVVRMDTIDFNLGAGAPVAQIGVDNWSFRAVGSVVFDQSGEYEFFTDSDDASVLKVDGILVVANGTFGVGQSRTKKVGRITLASGVHTILVEYQELGGDAEFHMGYTKVVAVPAPAPVPIPPAPSPSPTYTDPTEATPGALAALLANRMAGSVVTIPPKVYREASFIVNNLIIEGDGAVVKGSDIWPDSVWTKMYPYTSTLSLPAFPITMTDHAGWRSGRPEMVHRNGVMLTLVQTLAELGPGKFFVNGTRKVVLGDNPAGQKMEVTVRRGWGSTANATVRGVRFEHAATEYDKPALENAGGSTTFDRCIFRFAHASLVRNWGNKFNACLFSYFGKLALHGGGFVNGGAIFDMLDLGFEQWWEGGGQKEAGGDGTIIDGVEVYRVASRAFWGDFTGRYIVKNTRLHHMKAGGGAFLDYEGSSPSRGSGGRSTFKDCLFWDCDDSPDGHGSAYVQNSANIDISGLIIVRSPGIKITSYTRPDLTADVNTGIVVSGTRGIDVKNYFIKWDGAPQPGSNGNASGDNLILTGDAAINLMNEKKIPLTAS